MKNRKILLICASLALFCLATGSAATSEPNSAPRKSSLGKIRIEWEDAKLLAPGGYAREHE